MTAVPERRLDDVLVELAATHERLAAASEPGERIDLRDRLHELRAEAAMSRGSAAGSLSAEQLRAAIRNVERSLERLRSGRFDTSLVAGASGYGGGLDPIQTARHNQRVDEAGGRRELEAERAELLRELARRS